MCDLEQVNDGGRLLKVEGLNTWFKLHEGTVRAVDGVSFEVPTAGTVALVGESGSGKTVTALSLARLVPVPPGSYAGGRILFDGEDVLRMSRARLTRLRRRELSYIFQEPAAALNPVFRVGWQVGEALAGEETGGKREAVQRLLETVGLPDPARAARQYPHELSGGMQQRVVIAMALACRPRLLVADEPTTALDVTIQAQILDCIVSLQESLGMAVLLITHNLGLVEDVAHFVNIMYAGRIVEAGRTEDVLSSPRHPYTKGLLDAVPRLQGTERRLKGIDGTVPSPLRLPAGCKFAPRCSRAADVCRSEEPGLDPICKGTAAKPVDGKGDAPDGHKVCCYFPLG